MNLEPLPVFLMKVIFSTWSKHVFALAPQDDCLWDEAYPFWYICSCRHGSYYEDLRSAYIKDSDRFDKKKNYSGYYAFHKFLEVFLFHYSKCLSTCNEKAATFLSALYANYQIYTPSKSSQTSDTESYSSNQERGEESVATTNVLDTEDKPDDDSDNAPIASLVKPTHKNVNSPTGNIDVNNDDQNSDDLPIKFLLKKTSKTVNNSSDTDDENSDDLPITSLKKKSSKSTDNSSLQESTETPEPAYTSDDSHSSNELLNRFCPSKTEEWILTEDRLAQVENPQMKEKIILYQSFKQEMIETEPTDQTTQSRRQGSKGHHNRKKFLKRSIQKLEFELQTFVRYEDWYKQAKKDISIQSDLHSIEYVDVASRDKLTSASKKYLTEFSKMDNNDKQEMFEENNTHNLNDKNHFVMYYGKKNKAIVVHESWFEVNTEQFQGRRINLKTVEVCKNKPNHVQKLKGSEKKN